MKPFISAMNNHSLISLFQFSLKKYTGNSVHWWVGFQLSWHWWKFVMRIQPPILNLYAFFPRHSYVQCAPRVQMSLRKATTGKQEKRNEWLKNFTVKLWLTIEHDFKCRLQWFILHSKGEVIVSYNNNSILKLLAKMSIIFPKNCFGVIDLFKIIQECIVMEATPCV